jgi:methionyl-tRNA synthetase
MTMTTHYFTTPIYYANDVPHIGHAYTTIAADAVARYHRQQGHDTFLLTGTDEHGINIERIAAERGHTPQQQVDQVAWAFQDLWQRLDIRPDRFIRTTEPAHRRAALAFWDRLKRSGDVYRGVYEGAYCPRCEAYYQPDELLEGDCPIHQLPCDRVAEENWFFRLSAYQSRLEQLIGDTPFVEPVARRNEVLGVLRQGLRDFSASRRQVGWGIPVPESPGEVLYVWVDALANYLTGVGFPDDSARFERYWPTATHLVGKEIIRFHCLYWPALLLSAGLPLPKRVFAHGWLTKDGQKISKTTGNVIDPAALAAEFGSDAVRYYFLRQFAFGADGDFSRASFIARYNADLANDFGNLVQRATTLAARYSHSHSFSLESDLHTHARELDSQVTAAFESLAPHQAVEAIGKFVSHVNRYIDKSAPWTLAKNGDTARLATVLEHIVSGARLAARHYAPIIPRAAAEAERRLCNAEVGPPLFPRVISASPTAVSSSMSVR